MQKTFAPTIPVRRKKAATPRSAPSEGSSPRDADKGRGRGKERGGGGREGEGRGRRDRDIVTSASVFSMGPAEKFMQKRGVSIYNRVCVTLFWSLLQSKQEKHLHPLKKSSESATKM